MLFELLDSEFYESVLYFSARMRLHLVHEHSLRVLLSLLEVLVDGRDGLSVLDLEILEFRVRMLLDLLSFHVAVVINDEHSVRCHIHVEFTSPESCFLSLSEGCYRVLCIACFLAVPEASVGNDSCLLLRVCAERQCEHTSHCQ